MSKRILSVQFHHSRIALLSVDCESNDDDLNDDFYHI